VGAQPRRQRLHADITSSGLANAEATLELALHIHHSITGNPSDLQAVLTRLRRLTSSGDYAYYTDIAHFMADLPLAEQPASPARWLEGQQTARARWRGAAWSPPGAREPVHQQ
jgi:hypothetical protein